MDIKIFEKFSKYNEINNINEQTETRYEEKKKNKQQPDLWNNNIIWEFLKTLNTNLDLTHVSFPVCITQARSFLENFTDYFSHWDFISLAANEDDPYKRMRYLSLWYLSGFEQAMKIVRKPYNPILGEVYRTMWRHPKSGSKTHYIAEQVSHHPPISAFYISNREDGWVGYGTVHFSVSFYGISAWAYLNGIQTIKLLKYNEEYHWSFPPTKASGFFVGPFRMEMGGKVKIECDLNPYHAVFDFKTTSFFSSSNLYKVEGSIMKEEKEIDHIEGEYFHQITINKTELFYDALNPPESPIQFDVPFDQLWGRESQYVWKDLTNAVLEGDSSSAAERKFEVEEWQRMERKEDEMFNKQFIPRFFEKSNSEDDDEKYCLYQYKYKDETPFDKNKEISIEQAGIITSKPINNY